MAPSLLARILAAHINERELVGLLCTIPLCFFFVGDGSLGGVRDAGRCGTPEILSGADCAQA